MNTNDYEEFKLWAEKFCNENEGTAIDGEYYDLPGITVYKTHKIPLEGKGRIEVNCVTPEAQEHFFWNYEITLDDLETETYKHLILQTDGKLVETYGKNVNEIDATTASQILNQLSELSST